MFIVGKTYSKQDIYEILKVPADKQRGAWDTGYREYNGDIFIFSNVGIAGRTGHDYNNYWDGDLFHWEAKTASNLNQPTIQRMLHPFPGQSNYLFTREQDRLPYTFEGKVVAKEVFNTRPVKIIWQFVKNPYAQFEEVELKMAAEGQPLYEGAFRAVHINKYERNPLARRKCIAYHGCHCNVCSFDFYVTYGDLGRGYIHVHHLVPISSIGETYLINPEKDLIPVCPNCHSMIHQKTPPIMPEDLKKLMIEARQNT